MMAKPMKTLALHYPMIQFLIISVITLLGPSTTILENFSVNATDQQSTSSTPSPTATVTGINTVQVGFTAIITF